MWMNIVSAILAGGLAGQIVTLYWGNRAKWKQDLANWLRGERYKAATDLLALVSATAPRTDYDRWPTDIRIASQRVHVLCEGGVAPPELANAMEHLYNLAKMMKKGLVVDHDSWTDEIRAEVRKLRIVLSALLMKE